jgi:MtN3 and saliva related transmembrane protein
MLLPLTVAGAAGYLAACCTTLSFIPQLVKIRREGGDGLSYSMLSIYLIGLVLWLVYGVLLHAMAVVVANTASAALVAAAIVMKATIRSQHRKELAETLRGLTVLEAASVEAQQLELQTIEDRTLEIRSHF